MKVPSFHTHDDPAQQLAGMGRSFPGFRWQRTRGGMTWRGTLSPTCESPVYGVRIVHRTGWSPRVFIDSPQVADDAPHRYSSDRSLCLYWPVEWRWSAKESLAENIVPWTALWLYYYEIWCVVGEWLGPSSPHGMPKEEVIE